VAHDLFRAYENVKAINNSKESYSLNAYGKLLKSIRLRKSRAGVRVPLVLEDIKNDTICRTPSSRAESKRDDVTESQTDASASVLLNLKRKELSRLRRA